MWSQHARCSPPVSPSLLSDCFYLWQLPWKQWVSGTHQHPTNKSWKILPQLLWSCLVSSGGMKCQMMSGLCKEFVKPCCLYCLRQCWTKEKGKYCTVGNCYAMAGMYIKGCKRTSIFFSLKDCLSQLRSSVQLYSTWSANWCQSKNCSTFRVVSGGGFFCLIYLLPKQKWHCAQQRNNRKRTWNFTLQTALRCAVLHVLLSCQTWFQLSVRVQHIKRKGKPDSGYFFHCICKLNKFLL